jgi:hypothetical protein
VHEELRRHCLAAAHVLVDSGSCDSIAELELMQQSLQHDLFGAELELLVVAPA